jgi:hypothetical protein
MPQNGIRTSFRHGKHRKFIALSYAKSVRPCRTAVTKALKNLLEDVSLSRFSAVLDKASKPWRTQDPYNSSLQKSKVLQRWETATAAHGKAFTGLTRNCNIFFVSVRMHRGVDVSIENKVADLAFCHYLVRCRAQPYDVISGISASPNAGFINDPANDKAIWPYRYWKALKSVSSERMVVWALVVSRVRELAAFHVDQVEGPRKTAILKRNSEGELVLRTRSHVRVPPGGLDPADYKGKVLLSTTFHRWASDLECAPIVPKSVRDWLASKHFGLGHRCPDVASASHVRSWASAVRRNDHALSQLHNG